MIVGQDFDTVDGFNNFLEQGEEDRTAPTWRNLLQLLDRCQIPRTACILYKCVYGSSRQGKKHWFRGAIQTWDTATDQPTVIICAPQ